MSSAVSVCSIGSGGLITDDAAMDAWLSGDTVEVLGHELQRDSHAEGGDVLGVWLAMVGAMHALIATRYAGEWRVSLLSFARGNPSATGTAPSLDEAAARMLVVAHRDPMTLGIDAVLRIAGLPRPAPVPRDELSIAHGCEPSAAMVDARDAATIRAVAR